MYKKELGEFQITSGSVYISDPCYDIGTWCQGKTDNVKNGTWKAHIIIATNEETGWGNRVAELVAIHESAIDNKFEFEENSGADIGVDSGQAGIFDKEVYKGGDDENWYEECCDKTLSENQAGVLEGGVVSSSGFGDGSYNAFYERDEEGNIIAIKIDFLSEEEEDDEDDEELDDPEDKRYSDILK
jgi:hypothetical protein